MLNFDFNPFPVKKAARNQVQIIAQNAQLGKNLLAGMKGLNLDFENVNISSLTHLNQDPLSSLIPALSSAHSKSILSIIVGYDYSLLKAVFDGYQFIEQPFCLSHCQDSVGIPGGIDSTLLSLAHPNLYHYHLLGTQASKSFSYDENRLLTTYRLGALRSDLSQVEPEIRTTDIMAIDVNSMKFAEMPCQSSENPVGFTTEEICQLTYYSGRAEKVKVLCLYGFEYAREQIRFCLNAINQAIWYFLQGVNGRKTTYPSSSMEEFQSFVVEGKIDGLELAFYKDESQQKWWLKNPFVKNPLYKHLPLIACDYNDYNQATAQGELSDRLLRMVEIFHI